MKSKTGRIISQMVEMSPRHDRSNALSKRTEQKIHFFEKKKSNLGLGKAVLIFRPNQLENGQNKKQNGPNQLRIAYGNPT